MTKEQFIKQKIKVRVREMLNKIAPGERLVICVASGKDYWFEKVDIVEAMMKIAKRKK